ncbi:MAG: O-antigen ligase domain-containing protein [Acidobacteria bacterium]|nr:MAG: O-antigen ligase domain-containing protein [Acidobacteriota bacterium]
MASLSHPSSLQRAVTPDEHTRFWKVLVRTPVDCSLLILGLWAVPISIAVSEFFLTLALLARIVRLARGRDRLVLPRVFHFWMLWAALEIVVWCLSPEPSLGWGEIRHLLLIGALFVVLPALNQATDRLIVWQGLFLGASMSSLVLVGDFISRLFYYRRELAAGGDVGLYLRSGGLLNHWMVYGTVEILVVAGLLSFWSVYPEERRRWWPVAVINGAAILVSLTRMVWATLLALIGIELTRRRSRWIWALPLLPLTLFFLAPLPIRERVTQSFKPSYYSNLERIEMLKVGWDMIKEHPLTGVGPGRIDKLYMSYLSSRDPVPAYHGHLHNNAVELAAEFGIPVALAALLFVAMLFRDLLKASKAAQGREEIFVSRTAMFALIGYLLAGLFEYTYGHSLGLILLSFAVLAPLIPSATRNVLPSDSEAVGSRSHAAF